MAKIEQLNSYLEVKQQTDRDVRLQGSLVSARYEADSTDSQTVINLPFTVTQDADQKRAFQLYIDGRLLSETNDYTFTNISSNLSAQVTLTAPLIAGLPIQALKIGAYQENYPNASSVAATLVNDVNQPHKLAQDAFQPFIKKTFITAPNTTVVNRAQVEAASLKSIMGTERIIWKNLSVLKDEFGANGEPVYETASKDSRVRFVGTGWTSFATGYGTGLNSAVIGDFFEVTFYGTGLNWLIENDSDASTDWRVSIDGGAEGSDIWPTYSAFLQNRNYNNNQVLPITSGLSLGWHTVKIRHAAGTSSGSYSFGVEILNERTNIATLAGVAYNGTKQDTLSSLTSTNYNAGISGTRGARVIKYLRSGAISQAVQEVNASAAYMSSADHTNEEVVRRINFREFGANRSDDFSTLAGTQGTRVFTLDDGVTTLHTDLGVATDGTGVAGSGTGNWITITFVGCGLDVTVGSIATATSQILIDGISVAASSLYFNSIGRWKICSGLPYGTHTVKFLNTSNALSPRLNDFIIYQPKKPSIPSDAIEVADYCVLADFVSNTTAGIETMSQGVIRKTGGREINYSGSWTMNATANANYLAGFEYYSNTNGSYLEYTFFGTGFDLRSYVGTTLNSAITVSLNGTTLTTTNFPTMTTSTYGGHTFTASTGNLSQVAGANTQGAGFIVKGLPLAKYTLRLTAGSATLMYFNSLDVITPIFTNPYLKGSAASIRDTRAFSPVIDKPEKIDLSRAKAWICYDTTNNKILNSFNISAVIKTTTGTVNVYFEKPFKSANYAIGLSSSQWNIAINSKYSNYCNIVTSTSAFAVGDDTLATATFFGELEDEGEI